MTDTQPTTTPLPDLQTAHDEADLYLLAVDPEGEHDNNLTLAAFWDVAASERIILTLGTLKALLFTAADVLTAPAPTTTTARRGDPSTSHDAAKIAAVGASSARGRLLLTYYKNDVASWGEGLTSEAAVKSAGLGHQKTPWKRVSELKAAGLIAPNGLKRKGSSGAQAEVLEITPAGRQLASQSCPAEVRALVQAVG